MANQAIMNPAEQAAQATLSEIFTCIKNGESFRLEAGAGAGKTYSLVEALKFVIQHQGQNLLRRQQKVACITYTNVACDEIQSRIDSHPAVFSSTIHAFCWSIIKNFQPFLRSTLPTLNKWQEMLDGIGGIKQQEIRYDLGYRNATESYITVSHDDVLSLAVAIMQVAKFRTLLTAQHPIIFIDEYQDTNNELVKALETHFLGRAGSPLIGLFGDHWQKIYSDGVGSIEHPALRVIGKGANFRSVATVVNVLNRIRSELPQAVKDPDSRGSVAVYHTNLWVGERLKGGHWDGDLPRNIAHDHLTGLTNQLRQDGWDFSPENTKILMLTHKVLAEEQGYSDIAEVFSSYNDAYTKKEDPHIEFFVDVLEPMCKAYEERRYGDMFLAIGDSIPAIQSRTDKLEWSKDMTQLIMLRKRSTIGDVIDHLRQTKRPRLPERVEKREVDLAQVPLDIEPEQSHLSRLRKLRKVPYQQVSMLAQFLDDHSPFATKHGVKGAEFENVLVVIGRGWNHYNFNQMLEWAGNGVPPGKEATYERNRNLFYVVCSRPKTRLALLFTQKLTQNALAKLQEWFGAESIHDYQLN